MSNVSIERYWRVDIVCDSRQARETGKNALTCEEADRVANWFGTAGDLHAEVMGPLERVVIECGAGEGGVA